MATLAQERCFHHTDRQAAARCPRCRHCYCRECITEHDEKIICASCLAQLARPRKSAARLISLLTVPTGFLAGFLAIWLFFHLLGRGLLLLPDKFHEGTVWVAPWWDND